jgi:DNA repair exonuclease SbcCD ATPase subunit
MGDNKYNEIEFNNNKFDIEKVNLNSLKEYSSFNTLQKDETFYVYYKKYTLSLKNLKESIKLDEDVTKYKEYYNNIESQYNSIINEFNDLSNGINARNDNLNSIMEKLIDLKSNFKDKFKTNKNFSKNPSKFRKIKEYTKSINDKLYNISEAINYNTKIINAINNLDLKTRKDTFLKDLTQEIGDKIFNHYSNKIFLDDIKNNDKSNNKNKIFYYHNIKNNINNFNKLIEEFNSLINQFNSYNSKDTKIEELNNKITEYTDSINKLIEDFKNKKNSKLRELTNKIEILQKDLLDFLQKYVDDSVPINTEVKEILGMLHDNIFNYNITTTTSELETKKNNLKKKIVEMLNNLNKSNVIKGSTISESVTGNSSNKIPEKINTVNKSNFQVDNRVTRKFSSGLTVNGTIKKNEKGTRYIQGNNSKIYSIGINSTVKKMKNK